MQNWRPNKDQDEEDKKKRDERNHRRQQEQQKRDEEQEAQTQPHDQSTVDEQPEGIKHSQEEQGSGERGKPVTPLSDSESRKIKQNALALNKKKGQRPGTKSLPVGGRRDNRHNQSRRVVPILHGNSPNDSARSMSASTQHSIRSALSVSMTQEDPNESLRALDADESAPEVNVEALRRLAEFAINALAQPISSLLSEYKAIKYILPFEWQSEAFKNNKKKNRYGDIFCLDSTRVILRDPDGEVRKAGSYIHANYVSSDELHKTYILAQGPKKETVVDFWHMVWQVQCPVIVMLCDYMESGKKKCVQYLPPTNSTVKVRSSTGTMIIRTSGGKKHSGGSLIETHMTLTEAGKDLNVTHWKWTGWNDFKAPSEFQTVFRLLKELRHTDRGFPIVHCSAGVGRSGTLIALEACLAVLRSGKPLSILNCVETIRRQRAHSVQTPLQYLFLYRALLEMAAINDVITEAQLKEFRLTYEKMAKKS